MKLKTPIKYKFRFKKMPLTILKNQDGVTAVLVAIVAAMLLGFTALAIDVGYMYSTRNELQNVADAAALAGAGELGRIYLGIDQDDQADYNAGAGDGDDDGELDVAQIKRQAIEVAIENKGAGEPIIILPEDIIISQWDWDLNDPDQPLTVHLEQPDAVRVTAVRTSVATFFGGIFSFFGGSADFFQVSAVATAALGGLSNMDEAELKVPFGLSSYWFETADDCPDSVTFRSDEDCAGWHNFDDSNTNNDPPDSDSPDDIKLASSSIAQKALNAIFEYDHEVPFVPADPLTDPLTWTGEQWLLVHFGGYYGTEITYDEIWDESRDDNLVSGDTSFFFTEGVTSFITNPTSTNWITWKDSGSTTIDGRSIPLQEVYDEDPPTEPPEGYTPSGYSAPTKKPAPLPALFEFYRFRDGDSDNSIWTANVPVYLDDDCSQSTNTELLIDGFAQIMISAVYPPNYSDPTKASTMDVEIVCTLIVLEGRGSGKTYGGIRGSIPSLVQ